MAKVLIEKYANEQLLNCKCYFILTQGKYSKWILFIFLLKKQCIFFQYGIKFDNKYIYIPTFIIPNSFIIILIIL